MTDILIAGGGVAGASLAILLGRVGLRVELLERERFPREKPCGEGLMPGGVRVLQRMGLESSVSGAPFYGIRYHFGQQTAEGRFPAHNGNPAIGLGLRRRHFDHALFQTAAATSGVMALEGARIESPVLEDGRVVGVMVGGTMRRAKLVVAADGVHSTLRHALGLQQAARRKRMGVRVHFRLASDRVQPPWVDVFAGRGHELYVTPLPERQLLVAGLTDAGSFPEPLQDMFARWRREQPLLAHRLEGAEQLTNMVGVSPLAGKARCGFAPGVVLHGDAAGFLDPITGGGMTQALMTSELLAKHIIHNLEKGDTWFPEFDREREAMLRDYGRVTRAVLWLADHPRLAERALALLRDSPAVFSHFIGVSSGVRRILGPQPALS